MVAFRAWLICIAGGILVVLPGCLATTAQLSALKTENESLALRSQASEAQVENLEIHSRNVEDQLVQAEEDLAMLEERRQLEKRHLASTQDERDRLHNQFMGAMGGAYGMTGAASRQLADFSRDYPALQFDPTTGISKLDTDILFDTSQAEMKLAARDLLKELVAVLNSDQGHDLKVMVVGHTDNQMIAGRPVREKYPTNFHLSSDRALVVADTLREFGLQTQRMGVASFGPHQPVAPNITSTDRQKNRRVEIFVMAPEVPVVGWVESMPTLY